MDVSSTYKYLLFYSIIVSCLTKFLPENSNKGLMHKYSEYMYMQIKHQIL